MGKKFWNYEELFSYSFSGFQAKSFGISSKSFKMWAKTASYVSRKTFSLFVSEYIFSLISMFGFLAQSFRFLANLFGRVIEVASFMSGRIFWEKNFASKKFLFTWIFLDPGRKIFRVLACFVRQKRSLCVQMNIVRRSKVCWEIDIVYKCFSTYD